MAHGDAREGKWRGNWRMEWVASTLHTTSEPGVSNWTDAPADLNGLVRFARKTKSVFCTRAITFQTQSNCYLSRRAYLQLSLLEGPDPVLAEGITFCLKTEASMSACHFKGNVAKYRVFIHGIYRDYMAFYWHDLFTSCRGNKLQLCALQLPPFHQIARPKRGEWCVFNTVNKHVFISESFVLPSPVSIRVKVNTVSATPVV